MNWKGLKGSGHGLFEVLSRHFLEGLKKTTRNISEEGARAEVQTEHLPNTILESITATTLRWVEDNINMNLT
jgi:hypothetical protein